MGDYYSALLSAIGDLNEAGAQSRRSLYERAQATLLAELVSQSPRPSPDQIDQENRLLADAIRRIESEFGSMIGEDGFARSRDILLKVLAAKRPRNFAYGGFAKSESSSVSELVDLL